MSLNKEPMEWPTARATWAPGPHAARAWVHRTVHAPFGLAAHAPPGTTSLSRDVHLAQPVRVYVVDEPSHPLAVG